MFDHIYVLRLFTKTFAVNINILNVELISFGFLLL
jgi:hypothetical protein